MMIEKDGIIIKEVVVRLKKETRDDDMAKQYFV